LTQTLAHKDTPGQSIEQVLVAGDLARLSPEQRVSYYLKVCESLGLNPYTKPFEYIELNGKLTLYPRKDCTDQLRTTRGVSITRLERDQRDEVFVVTAYASDKNGRQDSAIGAASLVQENGKWEVSQSGRRYFKGDGTYSPLRGDDLANAMMKAETKAKRRVTLSICGLGMTDESEVETIPNVTRVEEIPREEIQRRAQKYVEIFGDDREAQEPVDEDLLKDALTRNARLLQVAYDSGVKGLRQLTAQATWPIARIEEANTELGERIKSHNADLDRQAAASAGQSTF